MGYIKTNMLCATGQVISYTPGDDGDIQAGLKLEERFMVFWSGGYELVLDKLTGLVWPKEWGTDLSTGGDNPFTWGGRTETWSNWLSHCQLINTSNLAGFNDWRIANCMESLSICDYSQSSELTYLYDVFINVVDMYHWTSTTSVFDSTLAYMLKPDIPNIGVRIKSDSLKAVMMRGPVQC